jgi:predicted transposase YbfD/YdcC
MFITQDSWISVDGKELRGTIDGVMGQKRGLALVHFHVHNINLSLNCGFYFGDKDSEMIVVRNLLENSDLSGKHFTLDALHCQEKTLKMIANEQGVFMVQVKENQAHLLDIINDHIGKPLETIKTYDKAHGRIEERVGKVYQVSNGCFKDKWATIGFQKIIVVERTFTKIKTQKISKESSFYLSNSIKHTNSQLFNAVRGHWGIESTHWIRDKTFGEDSVRCSNEERSKNLACLLSVALNLTKQDKVPNIKALQEELSADPDKMIPFFKHFYPK